MVREGPGGVRTFECFDRGHGEPFRIPVASLPEDYRFEVALTVPGSRGGGWIHLRLGTVAATFISNCSHFDDNGPCVPGTGIPIGSPVTLAIEKRGSVYRLLIEGREVQVTRYGSQPTAVREIVMEPGYNNAECQNDSIHAVLRRLTLFAL